MKFQRENVQFQRENRSAPKEKIVQIQRENKLVSKEKESVQIKKLKHWKTQK